jgi:UDP-N-acetylglucosamine--N-acetylmuramyl-(pentapeptide) pyrophosphoryl-undecaprenol N-acetylglucosamine transferase
MSRRFVIAAGGTGGHFFPAEALAAELLRRGHRISLMTDARSGGLASPVFAAGERVVLAGAGIAGRGAVKAVRAAFALARGTMQARRVLARERGAAVVGFGGYPSVAPVLAARLLRRRPAIALHEQNAVLGRANRALSRFADLLALSHAATRGVPADVPTEVTGNPVRPAIMALAGQSYAAPQGTFRLLVVGGSLGARVFSDVVPAALALLPAETRARLEVVQQCRAEDLERVRAAYAAAGIRAELAAFFGDMAARLAAAHLVVARAGASTVAELGVAGRPAVLVPLPGAIDDHQTENARALGGAWTLPQPGFTAAALAALVAELAGQPELLCRAAAAAAASGRPHAAVLLADAVELLAERAA